MRLSSQVTPLGGAWRALMPTETWFDGDVGDYRVRIWFDGRPQLWVQHGEGREKKSGTKAPRGRVKEGKAPEQVLAFVAERTGISAAALDNWIAGETIRRLSATASPTQEEPPGDSHSPPPESGDLPESRDSQTDPQDLFGSVGETMEEVAEAGGEVGQRRSSRKR